MVAVAGGWTESGGATFRGGIRSVASITICRPRQFALSSIGHTAITASAAMTEKLTGQPRCDRSMSHLPDEVP